ncbi:MAG: fatty acid desaturase [Paracoccaceae bacterium]|nr:fatty acid desaturase [Paracoccaceae bacterium]
MPDSTGPIESSIRSARDWVQVLARYRDPSPLRSLTELGLTLGPLLVLWALAWWALTFSWLLALVIAAVNGLFLVRLFAIQHDCGHSAYFRDRHANDWVGRALGVLTLTPYDVWRRAHSIHHSGAGNLDRRGMGDINTLTVDEYYALSWAGRFKYRLYRNPVVLFGLGPGYIFFIDNRLPFGLMTAGWRYWISAMGTNLAILAGLAGLYLLGGLSPILLVWLPTSLVAASVGVWLFYVQHQFETTHWNREENWQLHDAALEGSSHYVLPKPLQWLTANIGVHHVHHLYSRIPFYRLPEVLRDFPLLAEAQRMTLRESFANVKLHLWDEKNRRLLSYAQARRVWTERRAGAQSA